MSNIARCQSCGRPLLEDGDCPSCLLSLGQSKTPQERMRTNPRIDLEALKRALPQYEFLETLGEGASGVVLKARDRKFDRFVAIKVLATEFASESSFVHRFLQEARAMAALDHPGILRVLDFGRSKEACYLILEYVDGQTLRQVLRSSGLEAARVLDFIRSLCDALQYAHEQGVVHRDIKPENILLGADGLPKIADFGIARLLSDDEDTRLTHSEAMMGTPHYMAPEQLNDPIAVDHRADIFAVGVLLYEMLTGELPIGRFHPASDSCSVDQRVDAVINRALQNEPSRRYQHVAQLESDLSALKRMNTDHRIAIGREVGLSEEEQVELLGDYQHAVAKISDSGILHVALAVIVAVLLLTFAVGAATKDERVAEERELEAFFDRPTLDRVPFYLAAVTIKEGSLLEVKEVVNRGIDIPREVQNSKHLLLDIAEKRGDSEILEVVTRYYQRLR